MLALKQNGYLQPMPIQKGMELERDLLAAVASGKQRQGYVIWRSEPALVVPRSATHKAGYARASLLCQSLGWPVVVRATGGDLTPQTPGCINLSIVLSCQGSQLGIRESYAIICEPLIQWLAAMGIKAYCSPVQGSFCDGDFNLVVKGQKIAGTAQRRTRIKALDANTGGEDTAVLLHAIILCDETQSGLECMWDICNRYYAASQLNPFVQKDCHTSVSEQINQQGEIFIRQAILALESVVFQHLFQPVQLNNKKEVML